MNKPSELNCHLLETFPSNQDIHSKNGSLTAARENSQKNQKMERTLVQ